MFYNATSFECVLCSCNTSNTVSCNSTTGECICKAGFSGPSCDCVQNQHNCNNTFSYCSFDGTTPTCTCRAGFYGKNMGCFGKYILFVLTGDLNLIDMIKILHMLLVYDSSTRKGWVIMFCSDHRYLYIAQIRIYYIYKE
jgi:hypothetical protein